MCKNRELVSIARMFNPSDLPHKKNAIFNKELSTNPNIIQPLMEDHRTLFLASHLYSFCYFWGTD